MLDRPAAFAMPSPGGRRSAMMDAEFEPAGVVPVMATVTENIQLSKSVSLSEFDTVEKNTDPRVNQLQVRVCVCVCGRMRGAYVRGCGCMHVRVYVHALPSQISPFVSGCVRASKGDIHTFTDTIFTPTRAHDALAFLRSPRAHAHTYTHTPARIPSFLAETDRG